MGLFLVYLTLTFAKLVYSIHPDCSIHLALAKAEAACLDKQPEKPVNITEASECLTEWDGLWCWQSTEIGKMVNVTCTDVFSHFPVNQGFIYRNCTTRGWTDLFPPYIEACNFSDKIYVEAENMRLQLSTLQNIYTAGYSASLASLTTAIFVFLSFRKFHCTRNYIHVNLFASYILRATAVFIKDAVLFGDDSTDHCSMSTIACKLAVVFFQFSISSNFYWLLVEGLYLQTLLMLTFVSEKKYFWRYFFLGWGVPVTVISIWVLVRIYNDDNGCWDDNKHISVWWIIKGPILLAVLANFVIFLNVIRVLVEKLKTPSVGGSSSSKHLMRLSKSTLLLIPLFGVHYIVFAFFPEDTVINARIFIELCLGSFQGFVVALLYCFLNGEVQYEMKRRMGKWHNRAYCSFTQKRRSHSTDISAVNFVTQLSVLEKLSPTRRPSGYHSCVSSV
ncbi:growth hormone releasing hormone receptor a [Polypterus senegalus]|uniref:growth hormone releasing hormone receptor a n=1 Tax=Polypterus senegalus TaxID=55291 RepID=UPI0019647E46|nr:growth hormone releasing hormone receptor a [Polypterus senegalus]